MTPIGPFLLTQTPRMAGQPGGPGTRRRRGRASLIVVAAMTAALLGTAGPAAASDGDKDHHEGHHQNAFNQVDLVSDIDGLAPMTDPAVRNPWGIAFGPKTPLWVANQNSSTVTLYTGANGKDPFTKLPLVVTAASPTGMVFNPTKSFKVTQSGVTAPANFLFNEFLFSPQAPPVGKITGWSNASAPPAPTTTDPKTAKVGAFYGGLALVPGKEDKSGPVLLAADSQNGTIDVFDGQFMPTTLTGGSFVDPTPNADPITPYNVMYLDGRVYIAYAPIPGQPGESALSVFTRDGKFIKRLVTGGPLEDPWGMAIAPEHWGDFGGALLVGNVDDGKINAFNPRNGHWLGTIKDMGGQDLVNPGLWGIQFGNGVIGTPQTLIFAAGIGAESHVFGPEVYEHGLVGLIEPVHHHDGDDGGDGGHDD